MTTDLTDPVQQSTDAVVEDLENCFTELKGETYTDDQFELAGSIGEILRKNPSLEVAVFGVAKITKTQEWEQYNPCIEPWSSLLNTRKAQLEKFDASSNNPKEIVEAFNSVSWRIKDKQELENTIYYILSESNLITGRNATKVFSEIAKDEKLLDMVIDHAYRGCIENGGYTYKNKPEVAAKILEMLFKEENAYNYPEIVDGGRFGIATTSADIFRYAPGEIENFLNGNLGRVAKSMFENIKIELLEKKRAEILYDFFHLYEEMKKRNLISERVDLNKMSKAVLEEMRERYPSNQLYK